MKSELVVDAKSNDISIALIEDNRLVSLQKESRDESYTVGSIYIAKVKKIMPGLNAAFMNVGYNKDAFLHYLDLGSQFKTFADYVKEAVSDPKKTAFDKQNQATARYREKRSDSKCGGTRNAAIGANSKRANIIEGTTIDNRNILYRTLSGTQTI